MKKDESVKKTPLYIRPYEPVQMPPQPQNIKISPGEFLKTGAI